MPAELTAILGAIMLSSVISWWIPPLVARLPEPSESSKRYSAPGVPAGTEALHSEPHPPDAAPPLAAGLPPAPPKIPYRELARTPGLRPFGVVISVGLAAAVAALVGWGVLWWLWVPLVPVGVTLAFIDWHTTLLPTRIIAPAYFYCIGVVLIGSISTGSWALLRAAAVGWAVFGGVFFLLWFIYPRGLGYGDVRLSGVLGIILGPAGWSSLLTGMYAGFLLGGVIGGGMALLKLVDRRRYPFGPFLLAGALGGLLLGEPIALLLD